MLLRTYDPPKPNGQRGGKGTRGRRGSPGRPCNPGRQPVQPSKATDADPQPQDAFTPTPLAPASSTNSAPSSPLQRIQFQPVTPQRIRGARAPQNRKGISNVTPGSSVRQGVLPSRIPRLQRITPTRALKATPGASGSAPGPIANTQRRSKTSTGPTLPQPREKVCATEAGADTRQFAVAQESGLQVLCHSSNVAVRRLEVTQVAGDAFYGISAEDLERIQNQMWRRFQSVLRSLPPGVDLSDANSWIITNALGETVTLHLSYVQTYDDLCRFLAFQFRGKIGEQRVNKGRYRIADATNGSVVKVTDWGVISEERKPLVMSMLIEQVYLDELDGTCPKCDETELGTYIDQGWIVCRRCNTRCLPESEVQARWDIGAIANMQPDLEGALFRHVVKTRIRWTGGSFQTPMSRPQFEERLSRMRKERRMSSEKSRFQELDD